MVQHASQTIAPAPVLVRTAECALAPLPAPCVTALAPISKGPHAPKTCLNVPRTTVGAPVVPPASKSLVHQTNVLALEAYGGTRTARLVKPTTVRRSSPTKLTAGCVLAQSHPAPGRMDCDAIATLRMVTCLNRLPCETTTLWSTSSWWVTMRCWCDVYAQRSQLTHVVASCSLVIRFGQDSTKETMKAGLFG